MDFFIEKSISHQIQQARNSGEMDFFIEKSISHQIQQARNSGEMDFSIEKSISHQSEQTIWYSLNIKKCVYAYM